jgi:hypothetical protein
MVAGHVPDLGLVLGGHRGQLVASAGAGDVRESLDCPRCGAISRTRFMAHRARGGP